MGHPGPGAPTQDPSYKAVFVWTAILVAMGLVLTFPTFFQAFAPA